MLSIITINLNNCDGLKRTIDSVICQTFTDYEWIVIDGGSTDGSRELIEQYSDHFAYWVSEPDKGIYNAMNKGITQTKGEWILFLNSGDYLYGKNTLAEIDLNCIDVDIAYGIMLRGGTNGSINNPEMMKSNLHWSDFISGSLPHQSTFIKKTLFDKVGYYDEDLKAVADWKFFVEAIIYNNSQTLFIPKIISIYEGDGISDHIGQEEREKELPFLFPQMFLNDLPIIKTYEYLISTRLSKKIVSLLLKYVHLRKKQS